MKKCFWSFILCSLITLTSCGYTEMTKDEYLSEIEKVREETDISKIDKYSYTITVNATKDDIKSSLVYVCKYDKKARKCSLEMDIDDNGEKTNQNREVVIYEDHIDLTYNGFKSLIYKSESSYNMYSSWPYLFIRGNSCTDYTFSPWYALFADSRIYPTDSEKYSFKKSSSNYLVNYSIHLDEKEVFEICKIEQSMDFKYIDLKYDSSFFLISGKKEGDYVPKAGIFKSTGIYKATVEYKGSVVYSK